MARGRDIRTWLVVAAVAQLVRVCGTGECVTTVIATARVGNPANVGELSGAGAGGFGADRVCGAVGYVFGIGKYEVTAAQYAAFLNAVAGVDVYGLYNGNMASTTTGSGITRNGGGTAIYPYTYSANAVFANRPVNYVSYWDSCRFANWLHNGQPSGAQGAGTTETGAYNLNGYNGADGQAIQRNPGWQWAVADEDEWYKAAYYRGGSTDVGYWDFPTSSNTVPGRDLADASGNNANYYGLPYPIQPPYYTTVVGQFQNSPSPCGTFDQGGNVWEWNESAMSRDDSPSRGLRGGSFTSFADVEGLHAAYRYSSYPTYESGNIGFRVVNVPEPATIVILALGVVGMFIRATGSRQ